MKAAIIHCFPTEKNKFTPEESFKNDNVSPEISQVNSNLLTVPELAVELRIGRNAAYAMVKNGLIRSVRIGKTIRVPRKALEDFLAGKCYF